MIRAAGYKAPTGIKFHRLDEYLFHLKALDQIVIKKEKNEPNKAS